MPLTPGQRRLYSGDYNYSNQEWQLDGSVIVTISGGKSGRTDRMHIRNLWGEHEEVLDEKRVEDGPPPWLKDRLEEAGRGP